MAAKWSEDLLVEAFKSVGVQVGGAFAVVGGLLTFLLPETYGCLGGGSSSTRTSSCFVEQRSVPGIGPMDFLPAAAILGGFALCLGLVVGMVGYLLTDHDSP